MRSSATAAGPPRCLRPRSCRLDGCRPASWCAAAPRRRRPPDAGSGRGARPRRSQAWQLTSPGVACLVAASGHARGIFECPANGPRGSDTNALSFRRRESRAGHGRRADDAGARPRPWSTAPRAARRASTRSSTPPAPPSTPARAPSTTAWSSSSAARPSSRRRSPRAGTISDDGLQYTFHLRPGVKFQTTEGFTPTRDFNADDVVFTFERQWTAGSSLPQGLAAAPTSTSTASGLPTLLEVDREGRRPDRASFALNDAGRDLHRRSWRMDFASILSAEYADQMMEAGTPEQVDLRAGRHRAVPAGRLPEGRGHPLQGASRLLGGQGGARRPGLRHHARRLGALAEAAGRRVPRHALSEPGRPRGDPQQPGRQPARAGGPERRLSRLQHREGAVRPTSACARRSTWRSTSRRSSTRCSRAPARSPRTRCRRRSGSYNDAVEDYPYDPERRQEAARGGGRQPASRPTSGRCRCSGPTTRTPGAWPS